MRDKNSKMPDDVGVVYDGLYRELSWFKRTLDVLYGLYVDKPDTVAILNDIAPDFFGFLQTTLIDSLIVSLSRMTDNESDGKNKNLSFKRLFALIDAQSHGILRQNVENGLSELRLYSQAAREHRNKRVAHSDLAVALKSQSLPDLLIVDFRKSLEVAHETLNYVLRHFDNCQYSHSVAPAPGGYESLLFAVRRAHEYKQGDAFKYHMGCERKAGVSRGTSR